MPESLHATIRKMCAKLAHSPPPNEAAVSHGLVRPMLEALGWPVEDYEVVVPEYITQGYRVDFALCDRNRRPKVLIEVKRPGQVDWHAMRQVFEYAYHQGVPLLVLTDGATWRIFLGPEAGSYADREVVYVDLMHDKPEHVTHQLERYLQRSRVCDDRAYADAQATIRERRIRQELRAQLPKAWRAVLRKRPRQLAELLADELKTLAGTRPSTELCWDLLATLVPQSPEATPTTGNPSPRPQEAKLRTPKESRTSTRPGRRFVTLWMNGSAQEFPSARAAYIEAIDRLSQSDPAFVRRFAECKGRVRAPVSHTPEGLGSPVAARCAAPLACGWYLDTHLSTSAIVRRLQQAAKVAGLRYGRDIRLDVASR